MMRDYYDVNDYTRRVCIKVLMSRRWITYNELVAIALNDYHCYGDVGRTLRKMRESGYDVRQRPHKINGRFTGCKEFRLVSPYPTGQNVGETRRGDRQMSMNFQ